MDKVYQNRDIQIWLGERSENSDVALDFIEQWKRLHKTEDYDAIKDFIEHAITPDKCGALWDLIGRPWFWRRWIVQECVLSARKHLFVDDRVSCWLVLVSLVKVIVDMGLDVMMRRDCDICEQICPNSEVPVHKKPHSLPPMPDRIESLMSLNEAYETFQKGEEKYLTLEKLLDDFCGFISHDPKDGIYAFLSMASDTRGSDWTPDYDEKTTASQVYAQATRHIIRQTERLDIICRSVSKT